MLRLILAVDDKVLLLPVPERPAVLGTAPDSDVVVTARGVSRRHARLEPRADGVRLVDLGSKNGLVVDGARLDQTELLPGQHVRLGAAWLSLEEVSTNDAELAARLEHCRCTPTPVPGQPDTVELTPENASGLAAALRLVQDLQTCPDSAVTTDRWRLDQARDVLRAAGLFAIAPGDDEAMVLAAVAGAPPEPSVLDRATELARQSLTQPAARRLANSGWLLFAPTPDGSDAAGLAAWWVSASKPAGWQRELLAYLASSAEDLPLNARSSAGTAAQKLQFPPGTVLGASPAIQQLLATIEKTLDSGLDVLLTGETGTGKELFARMIHLSGPNPDGPFIPVNCPGIPEDLQEAEFFGIERNVATGVDRRPGFFQLADGGTLFLDEIGDMPLPLQAKLLRALQEREFLPVGASRPKRVSLRVVASTNRDLRAAVGQGRFRSDLYFRLRQLEYCLPPLREHRESVPALALEFTRCAANQLGKQIQGLSRKALDTLTAHTWPGNIRELQYTIQKAVSLALDGGAIESRHLERHLLALEVIGRDTGSLVESPPSLVGPADVRAALPTLNLDDLERTAIEQAILRADGNKSEAARLLGVSRAGLYKKMERLGLTP